MKELAICAWILLLLILFAPSVTALLIMLSVIAFPFVFFIIIQVLILVFPSFEKSKFMQIVDKIISKM